MFVSYTCSPINYNNFCSPAGRWGSVDSVDSRALSKDDRSDIQPTNIMRNQVSKMASVKNGGRIYSIFITEL